MNAQQLFFSLISSDSTHHLFKTDHLPLWSGIHFFIKELEEYEGLSQTYDFDDIQEKINEGYSIGDLITSKIGGITDKHFRDGCH